jgi:hypothetical protein
MICVTETFVFSVVKIDIKDKFSYIFLNLNFKF